MSQISFSPGAIVLYKSKPAVITLISDKITIAIDKKTVKRVRDKDIQMIHPGPLKSVDELSADIPDLEEAWELLDGESCNLQELTELVAGDFTPKAAWSTWQAASEGLLFAGDPDKLVPRTREAIDEDLSRLQEKQQQQQQEQAFYENIENATLTGEDCKRLSDVEMLAYGTTDKSKILNTLDIKQSCESAHRFLLKCGYWPEHHNPYPGRNSVEMNQPLMPTGQLADEQRMDLTALPAYAIDDENSSDPDDAISIDGDRLWVHVADVAALVEHDGELDVEARRRACNLYLPEQVVHMLPQPLTEQLGLGLQDISPALSIGFHVNAEGGLEDVIITPSLVKVTRTSYNDADREMTSTFSEINAMCERFRAFRVNSGAVSLDLPEASVRVDGQGNVVIKNLPKLDSRQMVTDAMLMAGCAVAMFCQDKNIVIPYATQPEPAERHEPETLSEMFAYRRHFKASRTSLTPGLHAGLGLQAYTRATSPLRRYVDLIVHQQLRNFLCGKPLLDEAGLAEKLTAVDQQAGTLRRTERQSNLHWKLVYLKQNPQWQGQAVIVNIEERKTVIMIPELALETKIRTRENFVLDDTISVRVTGVELPEQEVFFSIVN